MWGVAGSNSAKATQFFYFEKSLAALGVCICLPLLFMYMYLVHTSTCSKKWVCKQRKSSPIDCAPRNFACYIIQICSTFAVGN